MAIGATMTVALVGAIAVVWTPVAIRKTAMVAGLVLVTVEMPILLPPGMLLVALLAAVSRFRAARTRRLQVSADLAALCDLTAIGLTGGLGIQPALEIAIEHLGDEIADEVRSLLRQARIDGIAAAMSSTDGMGQRLYSVVGQASATGAPLLDSVASLADELHADMAADRLQAVRRLPVTMLFPLTLLILPGFLLLTIAPAILDAFARLEM